MWHRIGFLALVGLAAGCDSTPAEGSDAQTDLGAVIDVPGSDTLSSDVGVDSGTVDAGAVDAGTVDSGTVDSGAVDAGTVDAGAVDAGAVDAGTVDAGAVDAGPGACNALVNDSPMVTLAHVAGAPPAATGGALVDGVYDLTARTAYSGTASGCTGGGHTDELVIRGKVVITSGVLQFVTRRDSRAESRATVGGPTATTSPGRFTYSCPIVGAGDAPYSANATTFTIYDTANCFYDVYTHR